MEVMNIEPIFAKIEQRAKAEGCEVELLVERGERFSVSFQGGKPEKYDTSASHCAGFRVINNGYEGYAYSENLSEEALMRAYQQARENAEFTAIGADPSKRVQLLRETSPVSEMKELYNNSIESLSVEQKLERASQLESVAKAVDPRIASIPYNGYTESQGEVQILTSAGVRRSQRVSGVMGYAYCLAKQGEEGRMAGESFFTRHATEFNPGEVARTAAERALEKLGAEPPPTGMYPIVIDHEVASELFGLMSDYFSAKAVEKKNSLFADDLGKEIASSKLTVIDDPFLKDGVGSRSFDSEGAPSKRTPLIENGKLANFLTNSTYAARMELPHTASASRGPEASWISASQT